jgi:hypothetical protein
MCPVLCSAARHREALVEIARSKIELVVAYGEGCANCLHTLSNAFYAYPGCLPDE